MIFISNIASDAQRAFGLNSVPVSGDFYTDKIALCNSIYSGDPPWRYVRKSGLYGKGYRRMSMLNCAKVLCDNLAQLTFSNQVDISSANSAHYDFIMTVLQENGFWSNMPSFLSKAYALGGGAVKVLISDKRIFLDYVDALSFVPCGYSGRGITEGIFENRFAKGGHCYTLLEKHGIENDHAVCDRALFTSDNGTLERQIPVSDMFPGLEEHSEYYRISAPLFAYFRSAEANNFDSDSVLGISCFANCIDTLQALDVAFDSFSREFVLGRKRIIVPSSCIRTIVDPDTGKISRYFDSDDEVYQALKCDEERDLKITDNTTELRVTEHVDALNSLLDILCFQTGLSSGTLSFSSTSGVKTAEEIKSREIRTELTMQNNRNLAAELIETTCVNILRAGMAAGLIPEEEISVTVRFSDKQTIDTDTVIDRNIRLVEAGLKSPVTAIKELYDCSESEAEAELRQGRLSLHPPSSADSLM